MVEFAMLKLKNKLLTNHFIRKAGRSQERFYMIYIKSLTQKISLFASWHFFSYIYIYILNRIYYVAAEQSYVETCEEERQARPVGR